MEVISVWEVLKLIFGTPIMFFIINWDWYLVVGLFYTIIVYQILMRSINDNWLNALILVRWADIFGSFAIPAYVLYTWLLWPIHMVISAYRRMII